MASTDKPQGARFSQVYIERGEPTEDSVRMRHRIGSLIRDNKVLDDYLGREVERRIGIFVSHHVNWPIFLKEIILHDVLDLVTVASDLLRGRNHSLIQWLQQVQQIFIEENVHYRVDGSGGVHFYFDEEFARSCSATIAALDAQRYRNVSDAFNGALKALSKTPPDGKGAIRQAFAATEGLFRLMFPDAPHLKAKEVDRLQPRIQAVLAGDAPAQSASSKLLASFRDWIDAAHVYRHEPGAEEVSQPPLTLARKLSGFARPSQANRIAFDRAVDQVTAAARELLEALVTNAPPRDREVEASKARSRAAGRFSASGRQ
jgi:hypothetical protein